jgi:hypothetical protein
MRLNQGHAQCEAASAIRARFIGDIAAVCARDLPGERETKA